MFILAQAQRRAIRRCAFTTTPSTRRVASKSGKEKKQQWGDWLKDSKRIWNNRKTRKVIRLARVFALCSAIGVGGMQYGMLSVAKDPVGFDAEILRTVLLESGVQSYVHVGEREPLESNFFVNGRKPFVHLLTKNSLKYEQGQYTEESNPMWVSAIHSQRVFHRVKESAHDLAVAIIQQYNKRNKGMENGDSLTSLSSLISTTQSNDVPFEWLNINIDEMDESDIEHWLTMERHLRSDWQIIVSDQLTPNAFVHAMLPRRVFIHVGLLNHFCKNDDQLAAVLGHELSHVLLKHSERQILMSVIQNVFVAAVVSMLDFTGLFGFVFEVGAFSELINWSDAVYSRHNETEADHLGEYLATMACYEPRAAVDVWNNATQFERQMNNGEARSAKMLDSHPLSTERAKIMEEEYMPVLMKLFNDCKCEEKRVSQKRQFKNWGRVSPIEKWESANDH
jgi:hypothetical protein